jgi:hypothetical protein
MTKLTSAEARSIASSLWGTINTSYRTNTRSAYFFSCAGHGGFIVDESAIPAHKREWVEKYVAKEEAIRYINVHSGKSTLMHGYRTRSTRMSYQATEMVKFYIFEEDCAYAIAVMCGINLTKNPIKEGDARLTFWNWYDETNPVVANRKLVEEKRRNGDPDLIISASGTWKTGIEGVTEVITADRKVHLVRGYKNARDEYNEPYLSLCEEILEMETA